MYSGWGSNGNRIAVPERDVAAARATGIADSGIAARSRRGTTVASVGAASRGAKSLCPVALMRKITSTRTDRRSNPCIFPSRNVSKQEALRHIARSPGKRALLWSLPRLAFRSAETGIERIAKTVTEKVERSHREKDRQPWANREPGLRVDLVPSLAEHQPPLGSVRVS